MAVPAKIVLKSTTKMSLSERFTAIQKMRPPPPSPGEVRAQIAASQQSSQQNRRLAQQMANRPSVRAALGTVPPGPPLRGQQQRSLKQRLGPSNVKARLTLSQGGPGGRGMRRGRGRGRGFRGGGGGGGGYEVMNGSPPRGRGGRSRGRGFSRGRGGPPRWWDDDSRPPRGRGGFGRPDDRYRGRGGGAPRGRGGFQRGERGGRGGLRGRGGRGRGRGQGYSKEQLDNQLEEYMTMTKSHLNQELDAYMADAD